MKKNNRKQHSFDPVLSRGIIAIVLVVLAIVIILSFFDQAGPLGFMLNTGILSFLFGSIKYASPFVLLVIAWFLVKDTEYDYRATHAIGSLLFFLTMSGLFHLRFTPNEMWLQALDGNGGGLFGMTAWPFKTYFNTVAGLVILIGLAIISLVLMFNTLIVHLIVINKKIFSKLGSFGKNMFHITNTVFVKNSEKNTDNEEETEDTEDYEEEDSETGMEKTENDETEHNFSPHLLKKNIAKSDVEENDEDEDEETDASTTSAQTKKGVWAHKAIIKNLPPFDLLSSKRTKPTSGDLKANAEIIQDTFREFGIDVDMGEATVGPTITRFTLKPNKGVKVSRIVALSNDLSLALAAHPIRIEAPIPGKSLVGIEVPNEKTAMVTFRELLESKEFLTRDHNMMVALGKDVAGKVWFSDLPRLPHLLIAGSTGSGKTVCVNTVLMSLLYQNTAETLRLIMVDPKRVELTLYNGIPHLLTPVITNTNKTINALRWTVGEMERRFEVLSQDKSRDITSYNSKHQDDKIPHIVFVVDELADLMATAAGEVETNIIRLAQMARAVGIHLVLATQRPSVDVITGLMKANIPGRIAFSLPSLIDSRTILDTPGAEKLLGRGDMLYLSAELSKPVRIQGSFITEEEMKNVVDYLRGDEPPVYDESIVEKQTDVGTTSMFGGPSDDKDALYNEAKKAIVKGGKASASFLQRKLGIGYSRAARILDQLEADGIVGPADGAKPREILITETEIDDGKMETKMTSSAHPKSLTVFGDSEDEVSEEESSEEDDEEKDDSDEEDDDEIISSISSEEIDEEEGDENFAEGKI